MAKLTASNDMVRAIEDLIAKKRITRSTYERAVAQGYVDAEIIRIAEENRQRKAKMAIDGAPTLYKREQDDIKSGPTPQWRAKTGGYLRRVPVGKELGGPRTFKVRSIVEQYGDRYETDKRFALTRYLQDADLAQRVRVADLNPSGGGVPGKRLGGLGSVPDGVRKSFNRHEWVVARLTEDSRKTARALVSRELTKPDGAPFSMEDFGGYIIPSVIDRNRRWGVSAGVLWALAGELCRLYALCPFKTFDFDVELES
ncbi:MAG TPA: hypothetical protein PKD49_07640 [Hyphomicrobium sp.]|nr:hypothetical protein [Hyphomicrobium sp.]